MKRARLPKWRRTSVAAALAVTTGGVMASGVLHAAPATAQSAADVSRADAPQDATPQQNIYDLINAERQLAGLPPLAYDAGLMAAAQAHADDVARTGVLTHVGSDGTTGDERLTRSGFASTAWGENLAMGYSSPADVVAAWLNSPDHRATLLNPQYPLMGVGIASGSGTVWWTVVLATGDPAATQPAAVAAPASPAAPISGDNSSSNSSNNSSNNSSSNSSSNSSNNSSSNSSSNSNSNN